MRAKKAVTKHPLHLPSSKPEDHVPQASRHLPMQSALSGVKKTQCQTIKSVVAQSAQSKLCTSMVLYYIESIVATPCYIQIPSHAYLQFPAFVCSQMHCCSNPPPLEQWLVRHFLSSEVGMTRRHQVSDNFQNPGAGVAWVP